MVVCLRSHREVLDPCCQKIAPERLICSSKYSGHICALACVLAQAHYVSEDCCSVWFVGTSHLLLLAKTCQTSDYEPGQASLVCIAPALSVSSLSVSHSVVKWLCVSFRFRGKALPYKHVFGPRSLLPDQVMNLNTVDPKTCFAINTLCYPLSLCKIHV